MDLLWPELDPAAAAANLRKTVHHARRALSPELIVSVGDLLCLPADLRLDIDEFSTAAAVARRSGDPDSYAHAVELYGDGLLPDDRYEECAIDRRDELHC